MKNSSENNPKISVIMTVKNGEKYLKESLDSVLKQTFEDIEIVCIEGNSTDKTMDILESYQSKDKRIKIYKQERPGIGVAKNMGIEKSIGDFITFLDADDYYMDENALSAMYNAAIEHDVKVCGALRRLLNIDGEIEPLSLHRAYLVGFPKGRMFYYENLQYDYHFHSYIYDREMIQNSDARFAETRAYDDTHFFIRAMMQAQNFYVVPVELYCYRLHGSYVWSEEVCCEALESLIDQLNYTSANNLDICHYIAMQRLNYEYGPMFEKYIKEGNFKILELVTRAQNCINNNLIAKIMKRRPDQNIINAMNFPDYDIKVMYVKNKEKFVLTTLYNMLNDTSEYNPYFDVERVYNSKTYKTGKAILWVPRKLIGLLKNNNQ